ncbi:TonB-dependent receptor [Mesobaculum littorinae]|uniref:TonB-dependent receptor n=1 Tax=Mesobaculum littorinae TaxID=2486419 RepID=A0A438AG92_9RHOB|nr:TonB-dependent receptor [Mesobaculum littorinae]RVV97587.1 TonB-dependent receptor [Mesobaculum littorinae]
MPRRQKLAFVTIALGAVPLCGLQAQEEVAGDFANLGTVVLTAAGYEQLIADAPASITVVEGEDLADGSYETITDALDDVPGVALEGGGKLGNDEINIRGLGEDYVLLLVDGRPIGSTGEAFYNGFGSGQKAGFLPPASAIDRIEVIRGPMSSLYGTDAAGGVINVITKPVPDDWGGEVTIGTTLPEDGDAGDSHQGRFYLSGPVSSSVGLSLYGQTHSQQADAFIPGEAESRRRTLGGTLTWAVNDDHELKFNLSQTEQSFENALLRRGEVSVGEVENTYTNYGVTHRMQWGQGHETTTFLIDETVDIENGDYTSSYGKTQLNTKTTMYLARQTLTFGADYATERTEHDENRFSPSISTDLDRWHAALFAEDEIDLTDRFALTLGLRYDHNENYGSNVTPRVYGVYDLTPALTLKGGVSGGYRVPELKQADAGIAEPSGGRGSNALDVGNTDLQPEESTNYEFGLVWEGPRGIQASATVYHTSFENKIDRDVICDTPEADRYEADGQLNGTCSFGAVDNYVYISEYVNRDEAELNGAELTFDMPVGDFDLSANYTYSDSEITSGDGAGDRFNGLPAHAANFGVRWSPDDAPYGLWGKVKYRGDTTTIGRSAQEIPAYTLVDAGFDYDIRDNVRASVNLSNVFDTDYDTELSDRSLAGRRLYVGLTSRF